MKTVVDLSVTSYRPVRSSSAALFTPKDLFLSGAQGAWFEPSLDTCFTDTGGTTPVSGGDLIARINDRSGNANNATQATAPARPLFLGDADGTFISHDGVDDSLSVALGNLGAACTIGYVTRAEVRLLEAQTVNGSYTFPDQEIAGLVLIDRALTLVEKVNVVRYLASLVTGVTYGAEIDRLTLICLNAVDVVAVTSGAPTGYPAQFVAVAETDSVEIYDATTPDLPLHASLDFTGSSLTALDYAGDAFGVGATTGFTLVDLSTGSPVSTAYTTSTTPAIVNNSVNDVAMTVLAGASVPTIALGTDGGVSVIKDNGTVVNSGYSGAMQNVQFSGGSLIYQTSATTIHLRVADGVDSLADGFLEDRSYFRWFDGTVYYPAVAFNIGTVVAGTGDMQFAAGKGGSPTAQGLYRVAERDVVDASARSQGMVARTTSDHTSGWLPGNIKGAWLADTDATDLVGGTDADRSTNANALTVTGTITRSPVATGAELVAYSGLSAGVNELTLTDASMSDTLYGLCWVQVGGVWELQHGVMSGTPIEGVSITGTTLTVAGSAPKALLRLTATTPSAEQLAQIEVDETGVFEANAACTLHGASDAVTALAHDPVTGILHVGTSAGRSTFEGLRRTGNTDTSVSTAIGASGGLVAEK